MRLTRVAAAATSLLLLGAATSIGSAGAASTGVGTSKTSTNVLNLALGNSGSLLGVKVLSDDAQSTIDSASNSVPLADSKLTVASLSSSTVSALNNVVVPLPPIEAKQPGGSADVNSAAIDLANPAGLLGVNVPVPTDLSKVLSGTVSLAHLTASAASGAAKSTLANSLANLGVAGGLLSASAVNETSAANATSSESDTTRSAKVDAITVLDLASLLEGLGIPLTDLTISQVDGLLSATQTAVTGLAANTTLTDTLSAVQTKVNDLQASIAGGTLLDLTGVQGDVDALGLGDVINTSTITNIASLTDVATQYGALIDALKAGMATLLDNALAALDAAPLLKLNGVDITVATKAADTAANSVATVTAAIGGVSIGSVSLPGINLLQAADAVNSAVKTVNDTVAGALDTVQTTVGAQVISLKDLVSVSFLQKDPATGVSTANGYTVANAGVSAVSVKITPPAELSALVSAITAQGTGGTSIGSTISNTLGAAVPTTLSAAMPNLNTALAASTGALAQGATLNLVQVLGNSQFKVAAAPVASPQPTLPRTGGDAARLAALGFFLVALGLGLGRWLDLPVPAVVSSFVRRRR